MIVFSIYEGQWHKALFFQFLTFACEKMEELEVALIKVCAHWLFSRVLKVVVALLFTSAFLK